MKNHFIGLITILSVLLTGCYLSKKKQNDVSSSVVFESIKHNDQVISVNASLDQVLTLDDGVVLVIPHGTLVDKNGKTLNGKVELTYRSYNSAGGIIASGISMTAKDEDGKERQLESAGMFELRASANGEEVFIREGNGIQATVPSASEGDYDLYYFEESSTETSQNAIGGTTNASSLTVTSALNKGKGRWMKIKNAVKGHIVPIKQGDQFKLNWDLNQNPKLKGVAELQWQYCDVVSDLNPFSEKNKWVFDHTWTSFKISQPKYYAIKEGEYKNDAQNGFNYVGFKNGYEIFETQYPHNTYLFDPKTGLVKMIEGWIEKHGFWNNVPLDRFSTDFQYHNFLKAQECFVIGAHTGKKLYDENFNEIKDLGQAGDFRYFFDKHELVYTMSSQDRTFLKCIKPDGTLLKEKSLPFSKVRISKDGKYFAVFVDNMFSIYSTSDFRLVTEKKISGYDKAYIFFGGDHGIWIQHSDYNSREKKLSFWHWETGNIIHYPKGLDWRNIEVNPFTGTLIVESEDKSKRIEWDWRTKDYTKVEYPRHITPHVYPGNEILMVASNEGSKTKVFNRKGENPFICSHDGPCYSQESNFSGDRFFNIANDSVQLYDKFGVKIRAFGYSYSPYLARWMDDNSILVRFKDGSQGYYDKDGKVRSFTPGTIPVKSSFHDNGEIYAIPITEYYSWTPVYVSNGAWGNKVYDPNGNVVLDLAGYGALTTFAFDIDKFCTTNGAGVTWYSRTDEVKDTSVYRITLFSRDSMFVTSVQLSPDQLDVIEKYTDEKKWQKKRDEERKRKQNNVMRSFQINNFGIYNYDRYYEDNLIKCKANFELNEGELPSDATVFLITGENGRAVVKFWPGIWNKFYFSANWDSQILVVLPDDQVAIFDKAQFKKLDKEKIKKEGKHTFKLKTLSKVKTVIELDRLLNP